MSDGKISTDYPEPGTSQTSLKAKLNKKTSRQARTSSSEIGLAEFPDSMFDSDKSTDRGDPEVSKPPQKAEVDKNSFYLLDSNQN